MLKALLNERRIVHAELAAYCGVRPPAVSQWIAKDQVPAQRARKVSEFTGIPLEVLRPDFWPNGFGAVSSV